MAKGLSAALRFERVGIISKSEDRAAEVMIRKLRSTLVSFLRSKPKAEVMMEPDKIGLIKSKRDELRIRAASAKRMASTCDLLISVGGDGTILRCARFLLEEKGWNNAALLGINAGHIGFLTFMSADRISKDTEKILSTPESCSIEYRSCLQIRVRRRGRVLKEFHVLNDCVLNGGALSRMFEFSVDIDGELLSYYRSDGMVISTPTGSTAYNLAAGGSIVEPKIQVIQLTPICAQPFSNKPILIADSHEISIKPAAKSPRPMEIYLTLDGQTGIKLEQGDEVKIRKSPKSIGFLVPPGMRASHYFHSLRQKLKWGMARVH